MVDGTIRTLFVITRTEHQKCRGRTGKTDLSRVRQWRMSRKELLVESYCEWDSFNL